MPGSALVTGITGQDGGYLAERLVADGWQVHGTKRAGEVVPEHVLVLGDAVVLHELELRNPDQLRAVLAAAAPTEVYNLAGVSSVAQSWEEPRLTAEVNGLAVAALLECLRDLQEVSGLQIRFLQASSAELFAGATCAPQTEETAVTPRSPYGAAKAFAHHLTQVFRETGLHAVSVVLYNHESPRRPPSFVTRKITKAVAAIADGAQETLTLGNLASRRDWGWAPEYVEAMTLALRHREPADFVIATGVGHSVENFVATAFKHVGIEEWQKYVRTDPTFARSVDPVELVGDPTKARITLGWSPQVTFEALVGRMVDADRA